MPRERKGNARMWDRLRYEARIVGWPVFAMPLLTLVVVTAFAAVLAFVGFAKLDVLLHAGPGEVCLPLAAGIAAAAVTAGEPATELHLTLPAPYRTTLLLRLALALAWLSILGVAVTLVVWATGYFTFARPFALAQLGWFAPTYWALALGALLVLALRHRAASAALIGTVWGLENLAHNGFNRRPELHPWYLLVSTYHPAAPYWLENRLGLLLMAGAFTAGCWWLLHNTERVLAGVDA